MLSSHRTPLMTLSQQSQDMTIPDCASCHHAFVFTAREQALFASKNFAAPTRCLPCRRQKKAQNQRQSILSGAAESNGGGGGGGGNQQKRKNGDGVGAAEGRGTLTIDYEDNDHKRNKRRIEGAMPLSPNSAFMPPPPRPTGFGMGVPVNTMAMAPVSNDQIKLMNSKYQASKDKASDRVREKDPSKIEARMKQIHYGYNTSGYDNYINTVPKNERKGYKEHPRTPDPYEMQSKRCFDGKIRAWRKALHGFDTAHGELTQSSAASACQSSTTKESFTKRSVATGEAGLMKVAATNSSTTNTTATSSTEIEGNVKEDKELSQEGDLEDLPDGGEFDFENLDYQSEDSDDFCL